MYIQIQNLSIMSVPTGSSTNRKKSEIVGILYQFIIKVEVNSMGFNK